MNRGGPVDRLRENAMHGGKVVLGLVFAIMALMGLTMASAAVDGGFAFAGYVFALAGILLCYRLIASD